MTGRVDVFLRPDGAAGVALASLRRGDRLRVEGDLSRLPVARNPGQLDLRAMRALQGVHATHSMRQWDRLEVLERAEGFSLGRAVDRARDAIQATLAAGLAPDTRALAEAIVIGRRQALPDATLDAFERTGTYHLLAISGLHAALVAGALFLVLRLLRTPRHLAALIVLLATWAYALLADLRPSVVRASVMVTAYLIAPVLRRDADGLNALGLAALVLLLVRPRELEQVGFQLSFLAVAALIAVAAPLGRAARDRIVRRDGPLAARLARRAAFGVAALAIASAVAWAATQPLVQLHFHIVTPLALVANLASSALLGLALAAVLVYLLASFALPAAAPLAAAAADRASAWLLDPIAWLGALPLYAYVPRLHPAQAAVALALLVVAAVALVRAVGPPAGSPLPGARPSPTPAPSAGKRHRAASLAVSGIALVLAVASLWPLGPRAVPDGALRLTVLDVSHGQAALLEAPGGGVALFDCGSSRIKPGRRVVAPAIWHAGYARIDHVFLSHPDADHINGVLDLADRISIGGVHVAPAFLAEPRGAAVLAALAARGVPTHVVREGETIPLTGGALAHVIAAPELLADTPSARQSNDASLVVRVALGARAVLAPGDVQEAGTRRLLAMAPADALTCDVLLAPHHGARNRHTGALARAAGPRLAVASGRKRSAARSTLVALEAEGARVLETWQLGAVGVELAPDGVLWRAFLGGW